MCLSSTLFPEPLGPRITVVWPLGMSSDTPRSTRSRPNDLRTFTKRTSAGLATATALCGAEARSSAPAELAGGGVAGGLKDPGTGALKGASLPSAPSRLPRGPYHHER